LPSLLNVSAIIDDEDLSTFDRNVPDCRLDQRP
jgi:hypothetical protein